MAGDLADGSHRARGGVNDRELAAEGVGYQQGLPAAEEDDFTSGERQVDRSAEPQNGGTIFQRDVHDHESPAPSRSNHAGRSVGEYGDANRVQSDGQSRFDGERLGVMLQ